MKPTVKNVWGDVLAIHPPQVKDNRGFFSTDFSLHWDLPMGPIIDINRSFSVRGTIRGLHLQTDIPQGKMVRAVFGHILDVFLDLRPSSETFGKASSHHLIANVNRGPSEWLWVPPGFAHGFQAIEDSMVEYLVDSTYSPETQVTVNYKSVIDFWFPIDPVVSQKDAEAPMLEEVLVRELPRVKYGLEKLSWEGR